MSRIGNTCGGGWPEFLEQHNESDMTIELAHEYARAYLEQAGLPVNAFTVDVKLVRETRISVSITPRPTLPSFSAEWDNSWRR